MRTFGWKVRAPKAQRLTPGQLARRLWGAWKAHAPANWAAQIAYYFMFSLFPALAFLATLTAYLPLGPAVDLGLHRLADLMPAQALQSIQQEIQALLQRPRPKVLTLSLLVTLWSMSRGLDVVRQALNVVYDVKERRPLWRTQGTALLATLLGGALILASLLMVILGSRAGGWLAAHAGVSLLYQEAWRWMRWPVTAAVVMLAAALTYWLLPDVKTSFRYITPGSVLATVGWMLATFGLTEYTERFSTFSVTYGSLAGAALLMLWLFITGLSLLIGGEVNAVLEHADARGKAPGAHAPGEAPPPPELRPSAVPLGATKSAAAAKMTWLDRLRRRRGPLTQ